MSKEQRCHPTKERPNRRLFGELDYITGFGHVISRGVFRLSQVSRDEHRGIKGGGRTTGHTRRPFLSPDLALPLFTGG